MRYPTSRWWIRLFPDSVVQRFDSFAISCIVEIYKLNQAFMEAIELIMKIWGIEEADRPELERVLKNSTNKHLGVSLMNLSAGNDNEAFQAENDEWMATYLRRCGSGSRIADLGRIARISRIAQRTKRGQHASANPVMS